MDFKYFLFKELLQNMHNNYDMDNYDVVRYGVIKPLEKVKRYFRLGFVKSLRGVHLGYKNDVTTSQLLDALNSFEPKLHHFEYLYGLLENAESKALLVKLLAFRMLGHMKVKLPLNNHGYMTNVKRAMAITLEDVRQDSDIRKLNLKRFNLHKMGWPIVALITSPRDLITEQYRYLSNDKNDQVTVENGDFVIDAGACFGDTALYFSYKTGTQGRVFSFEFIPENIEVFKRNMELNPSLMENIVLIQNPLWSKSDIPVYYLSSGPGSKVSFDKIQNASGETRTKTIDDLVAEQKIKKIDFIKMDIEGAELNALIGATETIRNFKPKLAICLYHSLDDFGTIPKFINELNLGYKFYLGHYSIHSEETVLFASVK